MQQICPVMEKHIYKLKCKNSLWPVWENDIFLKQVLNFWYCYAVYTRAWPFSQEQIKLCKAQLGDRYTSALKRSSWKKSRICQKGFQSVFPWKGRNILLYITKPWYWKYKTLMLKLWRDGSCWQWNEWWLCPHINFSESNDARKHIIYIIWFKCTKYFLTCSFAWTQQIANQQVQSGTPSTSIGQPCTTPALHTHTNCVTAIALEPVCMFLCPVYYINPMGISPRQNTAAFPEERELRQSHTTRPHEFFTTDLGQDIFQLPWDL